jgi:hypothetical protein
MRKEYRIKVEELNNGSIGYIPQVSESKLTICYRSCYLFKQWQNLYLNTDDAVLSSANVEHAFFTEEVARTIIDRYKKQLEDKQAKQVKKNTYINL